MLHCPAGKPPSHQVNVPATPFPTEILKTLNDQMDARKETCLRECKEERAGKLNKNCPSATINKA